MGDGTIDLQWDTSPSAVSRDVGYVVLRRAVPGGAYVEIARTAAITYTDSPEAGTYQYVVRTAVSTFTSADGPSATASR